MHSEVRHEALTKALRATSQLVCCHDPASGAFSCDGAAEALTGRPAGAFARLEELLEAVHEEDRAALLARCERDGERRDAAGHRFRFVHPDGTTVACRADVVAPDEASLAGPEEEGGAPLIVAIRALPERRDPREESRRLTSLIEYLPDYVSIHSTDGRCLSMNAAGRRMLGIGRDEEVRRLGFVDIIADSTSAPAHLLLSVVMSHGSHSTDVVMIDRRSERRVPAAWSASLVSDGASASRYVVCIARDMSAQLGIEWELRQNQRRLTHALDVSRLGEWSMDIRTQTSYQSRRVSEIFGYRDIVEPWSYRVFLSHIHPDDRERVDRAFTRAIETGRDLDFEARISRRDGELRWISARASMNRGLGGEGRHIGGVIQDITRRRFSEQRDRFLADVSVPLNTLVDDRRTLGQVARLAVPFLGDHCSVDLLGTDGALERLVATNSLLSSEAVGATGGNGETLPPLLRQMLDARRPLTVDVTDPARLDGFVRTRAERLSLRALHVRSYLGVPLVLRRRQIGIMHFYRTDPEAPYTDKDRQVGQELATRVAAALENARLYRALQDSDHRKDEFLAMLSHEIRNPLESLSVGISLLENEPDAEQIDWARTMMGGQIARLSGILEDLLDVSRYTFNKVVLQRRPTTLQPLLEQVVDEMRGRAEARGYRVALESDERPLHAHIDTARFGQVISNLLTNAVKYGGERGEIRLTLEHAHDSAIITVSDEGVGIAAAELANVFELFSQVDTTIDRSLGGLGMGLTLVRRIIEMHGGSVVARSEGVGRGTSFVIRLPASIEPLPAGAEPREGAAVEADVRPMGRAGRAGMPDGQPERGGNGLVAAGGEGARFRTNGRGENGALADEEGTEEGGTAGGAADEGGTGEGGTGGGGTDRGEAGRGGASGDGTTVRRLMLVDDNVETVTALYRLFTRKGYEVRTAHDGLAALDLAETFSPHAAVLDIGLPGASGYQVASAMRRHYGARPLLLVALSGYGQQKDRDRSREAGFDHHLLKPASFRSIVELLERR